MKTFTSNNSTTDSDSYYGKELKIRMRILSEAIYFLENKSTIRKLAKVFNVSKSTVHKDLRYRLPDIDPFLYEKVAMLLKKNSEEKYYRGGETTKKFYEKIRKEKESAKPN